MNIHVLNKFQRNPYNGMEIDTTSNSGLFRWLSPFLLPVKLASNLENLWQFSKVYSDQVGDNGEPTDKWFQWRAKGWSDTRAHRYPRGKGAIPIYSYWQGRHLNYIQARKLIYAPEYAKNVVRTDSFLGLRELAHSEPDLSLRDYDGYDYQLLGMTLKEVINEPKRKMGHAFVLVMLLEDKFEECLKEDNHD